MSQKTSWGGREQDHQTEKDFNSFLIFFCIQDTERNAFNLAVATEPLNLVSLLRDQIGTHSIRFIFDEDR